MTAEDIALGAAWRAAEAALPEGWALQLEFQRGQWEAMAYSTGRYRTGTGPTPTAALLALAEKLAK